jgi:acyl-CoA dehydrogenase
LDRVVIDFSLDPELVELRGLTQEFIRRVVIPAESRDMGIHGIDDGLRSELQDEARAAGIFAPQVATELGGLGLDLRSAAVIFEEAGYSLLGPQALNCAAPDEGNMHLLAHVAADEQRERYLVPLAAGAVRSSFSMTEPPPGAGSDPSMLATRAIRTEGGWSITGRKWLITGADGAAFTICMAVAPEGATMFLVDAENPGWRIERVMNATDRSFPGGHAQVLFEDCRVPDDAVLGEVGAGFRYAQVRLAPARLTHCMRWLGIARRALDIALDYVIERRAFGQRLVDLGMVQERIAQSEIDIETSRALIWKCAWALDQGLRGTAESSMTKAYVAEAVCRVVDRAVQMCGGSGVTDDLLLARIAAEVRPFRIYDGPTETHLWSIARRAVRARERQIDSARSLQIDMSPAASASTNVVS